MKTQRPVSGETIPDGWCGELWDDVHACELSGGTGVRVNRTPNGTTVSALRNSSGGSGGSGGQNYTGYFKVIDASEKKEDGTITLKIKVVDGSDTAATICGFALVNGYIREISATTIEISDKSTRTAYLYLNAVEEMESDGVTPKTPVFEIVNQKLLNGTQINRALIATIKIENEAMQIIQQCYGVPNVFIWGIC